MESPSRSARQATEDADVDASSDAYAQRFEGAVGHWFLAVQTRLTLEALAGLAAGATILDVGGGHAQTAAPLADAGYRVTVVGSDPTCARRLHGLTAAGRAEFRVANLQQLPFSDASFDAVVCYRLLAHSVNWRRLIAELCRVARERVVLDYPSRRSVNVVSQRLFDLKRSVEGVMTRRFSLYRPADVEAAFASAGFAVTAQQPQFLLPMALHRLIGSARLARAAEWPGRLMGLTRAFGSPVILRADRISA